MCTYTVDVHPVKVLCKKHPFFQGGLKSDCIISAHNTLHTGVMSCTCELYNKMVCVRACMCVCVRACVRAYVHAWVRACMRVCDCMVVQIVGLHATFKYICV